MSNLDTVNLIIKAANQKFDDFVIDNCQLNWTIKELKEFLSSNYPKNPHSSSIRLIYSGKLLHDHFAIKDCIRHASDVNSHIFHLVHSPGSQKASAERNLDDNETDVENELTPGSSLDSESISTTSSSSVTSSPDTSTTNRQSNIFESSFNTFPTRSDQTLTPREQYELTLKNMMNYYQAIGVPVNTNPWYSSYVQQMALYNHMYLNYINAVNPMSVPVPPRPEPTVQSSSTNLPQAETPAPEQQPQAEQRPAQQQRAPRNQANNDADREDDWLGMLHNCISFLILLSIVYYYSSLERFLIILVVAIALICYHKGWLQLQRRRVVQPQQNQEQRREQGENRGENDPADNQEDTDAENRNDQAQAPTTLRLIFTFIFKFFTSLIPERPRAVN